MNKILAIAVGILVFTIILQVIQFVPLAVAHQNNQENGNSRMSCMMGQMSLEEMDKNNDGICDMCGMPISECEEMMEEHGDMEEMMKEHHGMMGMNGMNCHM